MAENTSSTSKEVSQRNSSTDVIAAGSFFTGPWEDVSRFTSVIVSAYASENGIVYSEFSDDAVNLREFKSYTTVAGVEESNTTVIPSGAVYCRTRFKNTGASTLTYLTLVTTYDNGDVGNVDATIVESVLPDGAATEVRQSTGNNTMKNIESNQANGTQKTRLVASNGSTYLDNKVSALNSTSVALNAAATFTGTAEDISVYNTLTFSCKTDQDGTLYADFSTDGTNWDSTLTYELYASINEVHRLTISKQYFRIRVVNGSTNQTYLRLQVLLGSAPILTSSANSTIFDDSDAILVRPLDFNIMVAEGLYRDRNATIKDGLNNDIDTGTTPEDVTNEGGVYAGFPTGTIEAGEVVVSGADTGTVYYSYMATATDLDYTFGSVAIAGAGTYALGHNIWRSNFAYFVSSNVAVFNVGTIILRNTVTTANVFWQIDAGYSQTFCAAYTVPYGSSVYIDRFNGSMRGSTSGSLDGFIWYRAYGESPRLRFPFELQYGTLYFDDTDYLIKIPERVDFIPRIITSSANNLSAKYSFRILKVK